MHQPLVTTSSMVDAVSAAMKPIVAKMTKPAMNAVQVSRMDITTASLLWIHNSIVSVHYKIHIELEN